MAKKKKEKEEPQSVLYYFYTKERWDNWMNTLSECDFEGDPDSEEMPEGYEKLEIFVKDITISVLKILKLYDLGKFTKEVAVNKINEVEGFVLNGEVPDNEIGEMVNSVRISILVLFSSSKKYLEGDGVEDVKDLVAKGRKIVDKDPDEALETASLIGASILGGAKWSKTFMNTKSDPTLFDDWLSEIETMKDEYKSLEKFEEEFGEGI
jgi:hypothetical protein